MSAIRPKNKRLKLKLPAQEEKTNFNPVSFWNAFKAWGEEQADMSDENDTVEPKGNA